MGPCTSKGVRVVLYRCDSIIHFDPKVHSRLILVFEELGRFGETLAVYDNWDPIERCERTKLAASEDGMIRSDLLVHEARIGATRGCVRGVSLWVKFYT